MGFWDAVASAGPYANNMHHAPDNHSNTSSFNFYRPDALPGAQPTESKHWRQMWRERTNNIFFAASKRQIIYFCFQMTYSFSKYTAHWMSIYLWIEHADSMHRQTFHFCLTQGHKLPAMCDCMQWVDIRCWRKTSPEPHRMHSTLNLHTQLQCASLLKTSRSS